MIKHLCGLQSSRCLVAARCESINAGVIITPSVDLSVAVSLSVIVLGDCMDCLDCRLSIPAGRCE